ncbi:MAG: sigma 54-interacting transcriptional regulator [Opitutales bacterium]
MRVSLLSDEKRPGLLKRLQGMGLRVQMDPPEKIQTLSKESTDLVYFVPFSLTETEDWFEHRVSLARASRYYVVFGDNLSTARIMDAARDGAHDVVDERDDDQRIASALDQAANAQDLWWQLYGGKGEISEEKLVGRSPAMRALRESVQRIGPTEATVLIMGESGTGKERVAEAVQLAYGRGPLVTVNCAAIPSELMEAELFGVEKGAYTGAHKTKSGLVEEATDGILFLDEIGEMDISLQPKLLRFLETKIARRVGSPKEYKTQVRVIAATNRELLQEAEQGRFRLDLYYRLSEVVLNPPPLRHRQSDIPDLALIFVKEASERLGKNFETIEPELIYKFQLHEWPGNVRELKQTIERLCIHYDGPVIRAAWWEPPAARPHQRGRLSGPGYGQHPGLPGQGYPPGYPGMMPGGYPPQARPGTGYGYSPPEPPPPTGRGSGGSGKSRSPFPGNLTGGGQGGGSHQPFPGGYGPQGGRGGMPSKKERMALARRLIEESGEDLTWVAAQVGVHPTTLYRWRKSGKV